MILDILKLLAFENMDVQIKKFYDCICIRKVILIPQQIYDKYPSYNYFNKVPLRCSEAIQKSMEVCSCDIPKLAPGDYINIDRFGEITINRLCDRKMY